jgi:hypothetical protein
MTGSIHCEILDGFKARQYLRIGVSHQADKGSLQIFPNEVFLLRGEERGIIFNCKDTSVKDISNYLSEPKRDDYFKIMQENKYRRVVQQTLLNQPISNFIKINWKVTFSGGRFLFKLKARNQFLMRNFMWKLIFREGNGV